MTANEQLLTIHDLVVEYAATRVGAKPFRASKVASLDIRRGESVGLVGESGSGSTALGRLVVGACTRVGRDDPARGRDLGHLKRYKPPSFKPAPDLRGATLSLPT